MTKTDEDRFIWETGHIVIDKIEQDDADSQEEESDTGAIINDLEGDKEGKVMAED